MKTTHHARFHFDPTTWVVSANSQFAIVRFLSLSFFGLFVTCTGRTGGPILTIYASYDVFLPKDVPFGGFVDMPPHLGVKSPPKPQFWGVNRRFPAKLLKSKNMHIIKTTASIRTKFCTAIKTTKCLSRVVQTHTQQIQDGGRPPSWKNRKITISRPRFEQFQRNFARRRRSAPLSCRTVKSSKF